MKTRKIFAGRKFRDSILTQPTNTTSECRCGCASSHLWETGTRKRLPLLPAIAVVLLPKCPMCLAAWLGIFGYVGTSPWLNAIWGAPLMVGLLSISVSALAWQAGRSRNLRPLLIGLPGAAALLVGKCLWDVPILLYTGLGLLAMAFLWRNRIKPFQQDSYPALPAKA